MSTTYDVQDLVTALAQRLVEGLGPTEVQRLGDLLQVSQRPAAEEDVFRREGQFWTLQYAGRLARLRDARGLQHLARLLAQPGTPVHVLSLVGESGARGHGRRDDATSLHMSRDEGDAALDAQALASYRQRLRDLDDELAEASEDGDEGRLWHLATERELLLAELSRSVGLGGRDRRVASPTERARVAVRKAIRSATDLIEQHHPELAGHLRATVRTGTFCSYGAVGRPAWHC